MTSRLGGRSMIHDFICVCCVLVNMCCVAPPPHLPSLPSNPLLKSTHKIHSNSAWKKIDTGTKSPAFCLSFWVTVSPFHYPDQLKHLCVCVLCACICLSACARACTWVRACMCVRVLNIPDQHKELLMPSQRPRPRSWHNTQNARFPRK